MDELFFLYSQGAKLGLYILAFILRSEPIDV